MRPLVFKLAVKFDLLLQIELVVYVGRKDMVRVKVTRCIGRTKYFSYYSQCLLRVRILFDISVIRQQQRSKSLSKEENRSPVCARICREESCWQQYH